MAAILGSKLSSMMGGIYGGKKADVIHQGDGFEVGQRPSTTPNSARVEVDESSALPPPDLPAAAQHSAVDSNVLPSALQTHMIGSKVLTRLLIDLNSAIYTLSTDVLMETDDAIDNRLLTPADLINIYEAFEDPLIKQFIIHVSDRTLSPSDLLDPIVQYLTCSHLMGAIFVPFIPGLPVEHDGLLKKVYETMQRNEPQDQCSRWRSLTYAYVSNPGEIRTHLEQAASALLSEICVAVTILNRGKGVDLLEQGSKAVAAVLKSAMELQDTIKREHLDLDYEIVMADVGTLFNAETMESRHAGGRLKPEIVWLAVGLGMLTWASVIQPDGSTLNNQQGIASKAPVISNSFTRRAYCPELDDVHMGEQIYGGPYSSVYKGKWQGFVVAIKVINPIDGKTTKGMRKKLVRELQTWWSLEHPRIVPLYGLASVFGSFGGMISPWYPNGNATQYLRTADLTLEQRIELWIDVVEGVVYLHGSEPVIIHGDLKPANVLIDDQGRARICDFGLVRVVQEFEPTGQTTTSVHVGTVRYLSKELLCDYDERIPTTASDVYALGCIALEFMFGTLPYQHRRDNYTGQITMDILQDKAPAERPNIDSRQLQQVWDVLEMCWNVDAYSRPSAVQLLDQFRQIGQQ